MVYYSEICYKYPQHILHRACASNALKHFLEQQGNDQSLSMFVKWDPFFELRSFWPIEISLWQSLIHFTIGGDYINVLLPNVKFGSCEFISTVPELPNVQAQLWLFQLLLVVILINGLFVCCKDRWEKWNFAIKNEIPNELHLEAFRDCFEMYCSVPMKGSVNLNLESMAALFAIWSFPLIFPQIRWEQHYICS